MWKKRSNVDTKFPAQSLPSIFVIHPPLTYKGTPCIEQPTFPNSNAPTLDLNATYALHSFSYLFYVFFSLRHIRQPSSSPITNRLQTTITYTHMYIYVCVCVISIIQKPKKKNLVQLYEYSNSNLLHRIVQRSINSKKK